MLTIDREKCLNSGQCAYLQPEIFQLDEHDEPQILNANPTGELIAKAQDAIAMCPAQAISLSEEN